MPKSCMKKKTLRVSFKNVGVNHGKSRKLKRTNAKKLMDANIQGCEPEFRILVMHWRVHKTTAHVNKLFRLLDEFKCPMENRTDKYASLDLNIQLLLRKNNCGYKNLERACFIPEDRNENRRAARLLDMLEDID